MNVTSDDVDCQYQYQGLNKIQKKINMIVGWVVVGKGFWLDEWMDRFLEQGNNNNNNNER